MENIENNTDVVIEEVLANNEINNEALITGEDAATEVTLEVSEDIATEGLLAGAATEATEQVAANKITDLAQIEQAVESIIFASPKAISLVRIKNLLNHFNYDVSGLTEILSSIEQSYENRGFQLVKVAGGYQFRTHPTNAEILQKLLEDKPTKLSQSALEVLAIIAYKQPMTRSEIDSVRGTDSGHLMKGLLEKNLVRSVGHAETPGRPLLYATAPYFMEVFGLGSLDDLPSIEEFSRELNNGEGSTEDMLEAADFFAKPSPLDANPNRGSFDERPEEEIDSADFGLADRAAEEASLGQENVSST